MNWIEKLWNGPAAQRLLAQAQAELDVETSDLRAKLGQELDAIDRGLCAVGKELLPQIDKARRRVEILRDEAVKAVNEARGELTQLEGALIRADEKAKQERQPILNRLEATCPAEVNALIDEIEREIDTMRANVNAALEEKRTTEKEHHFGGRILALFSNLPRIEQKIERLIEARRVAYSLRRRYVADLPAALEAIRDSIPPSGFASEYVCDLVE